MTSRLQELGLSCDTHNTCMTQLLLADEDIQAQRGKVTFSRQHSMESVIAKKESLGGEERDGEERKGGSVLDNLAQPQRLDFQLIEPLT